MPRIPAKKTSEAGLFLKLVYRIAGRRFGAVPEPMAVVAHHPALLRTSVVHELLAERAAKKIPANVRELAVYRVATRIGCSWCVDFGTMLQKHDGLDIERLTKIDDYATSPAFSHQERLALAYADAMSSDRVTVTDDQVAELEREFGRDGVLELTYQIALENSRARMNSALGIVDQGFTSGDACRVPLP
ncbi:carboxymuconolactone decarboxylase family protein [Amycolatopsis sp. NPDC058278]|jgi:AhpD family alkylhydroperoxidase|uniref:carboxymuconolactone decarboxylase family protein n=1 Tax=unclassified Amycolatopsis TaxID=2618356 RepID=UPI00255C09CD|nr:carboxymuconolactone decarboxylase family protein [Amycolatopsis sp. DG1A-15b]WIX93284.1 carboxymuconolactone decarboxylase family protein [Amycolatopsis sp. DG1A-15b]